MRKTPILLFWLLLVFFLVNGWTASLSQISITGVVKQPLNLTIEDLARFEPISVRLNEVTTDGNFHGVFYYHGVPLKTLLQLAFIEKEETDFFKPVDLAIVVRNKPGKQVVLSWAEVFYRNPAEVIIAISATPIMPHKNCQACHKPDVYGPWLNQLKRQVGFPKLIVTNDFYTDRCLEEIINIEVVNLHPKIKVEKQPKLFSPVFTITGVVKQNLTMADLSGYNHLEILAKQVGEGKGYHGLKKFSGVPLLELLEKPGVEPDLNTVLLISSPDGYRSLLSYGELFLTPYGQRIIIADKMNNEPLKESGRFVLITPDDLSADRWVKAVAKIEVIRLSQSPKLYVIGMGCGDTNLITLEAISYLGKADAFVCAEDIRRRFAKYLGDKPVLFDPFKSLERVTKNKELLQAERTKNVQLIRDALNKGKSVAYLDWGDPVIYGSWRFLKDYFEDQKIEIVPSISAFNVANALVKRDIGCKGSIVITVPEGVRANKAMLKAVAKNGDTLAIFMGLKELKNLMPLLREYYPNTTSVCLVYKAGYAENERIIRTTLNEVLKIAKKEQEKWLGLIYIGPCLQGGRLICP